MLRRVCVLLLVLACSATTAEARGLTVSTVKDPVRQIQTGARLRVEYSVRNTGTATAKASTARVALVRGRTVIALTNGRVPRLAARKAKALAVSAVVPARATGAYRVRVCVGTNCRQSRRAVTVTVRHRCRPPRFRLRRHPCPFLRRSPPIRRRRKRRRCP